MKKNIICLITVSIIVSYVLYKFIIKEKFTLEEYEEEQAINNIDDYNINQGKKLLADINTKLKILELKKKDIDRREKLMKSEAVKSYSLKDMQYNYTQKQNLIKMLKNNYKELLEDAYTLDDHNNDVKEIEKAFSEKLQKDKQNVVGNSGMGFTGL